MSCFTPVESTIGGFFIGVSMVSHYLFCGKETNVSSEFATFIKLPQIATNKWWKSLSYLVGLIAGGYLLTVFYPRAFEYKIQIHLSPILYRVTRNGWTIVYAVAGVLVGIGARILNGCILRFTLLGLPNLPKRSAIATAVFCVIVFLFVNVLQTADMSTTILLYWLRLPKFGTAIGLVFLLLGIVSLYILLYRYCGRMNEQIVLQHRQDRLLLESIIHLLDAIVFAFGLGISGITDQQKILGLFDIMGPNFDPSLLFIAIGILIPKFYMMKKLKSSSMNVPFVAEQFAKQEDLEMWKLILGMVSYSIGIGLLGVDLGPTLVSLPHGRLECLIFIIAATISVSCYEYKKYIGL